jgi:organic radical activating enzyme
MSEALYVNEIFSSIQGEGLLAGRRQIFVRLTECNLDCRYCDTDFARSQECRVETMPGSAVFTTLPQPVSLHTVMTVIDDWLTRLPGAHHSVSVTGGEPLLHAGVLTEWCTHIRARLPVHLETNGTLPAALATVKQQVDFISMDMKLPSTAGCSKPLWDRHRLFLLEAQGNAAVTVKVVVGDTTDEAEITTVCDLISAIEPATPLFLQPVNLPGGTAGIPAVKLLHLQAVASARLPDVRVIPQMHVLLGAL